MGIVQTSKIYTYRTGEKPANYGDFTQNTNQESFVDYTKKKSFEDGVAQGMEQGLEQGRGHMLHLF